MCVLIYAYLLLMCPGLMRFLSISILLAFAYYLIFLSISGLIFTGVLSLIIGSSSITSLDTLVFSSAFIVAWLAGLITPGAPAGVGVREIVIVILLKGLVSESDLLLAVLLTRVVTVGGDVLFFLLASLIPAKEAMTVKIS